MLRTIIRVAELSVREFIELLDGSRVRVLVRCVPDMCDAVEEAASDLAVVEGGAIRAGDLIYPVIKVVVPITNLNALAGIEGVKYVKLPGQSVQEDTESANAQIAAGG